MHGIGGWWHQKGWVGGWVGVLGGWGGRVQKGTHTRDGVGGWKWRHQKGKNGFVAMAYMRVIHTKHWVK